MRIIGSRVVVLVLIIALLFVGASCATNRALRNGAASGVIDSSKRMPDGKQWTTDNLNLDVTESYCYADVALNCRRYGRLYRWQSAQLVCQSLGDRWRLPTNDDWLHLANHYGGIRDASAETGRASYNALSVGGSAAFTLGEALARSSIARSRDVA